MCQPGGRGRRCFTGRLHWLFIPGWFHWGMETNAGNDFDAVPPPGWAGTLKAGQEVQTREAGHAPDTGVIADMTPDGSVVWCGSTGSRPEGCSLPGTPS